MQAAYGNYTYSLFTLDYFLNAMRRMGVRYIELWGAAPHFHLEDRSPAEAASLGMRIRSMGMEVVCFTPEQCAYPVNIASEDAALRKRSLALFEKAVTYAGLLGAPAVLVTPGRGSLDLPRQDAWDRSLEALRHLAEHARSEGVTLYFEHLTRTTTNLVVTMADMARYLRELGSPSVLPLLDLDMMGREGEGVVDFLAAYGGLPAHVHLVDGMPGGHLVPGDGVLPLAREMRLLKSSGYKGFFTFEVTHERYLLDPDAAILQCMRWLDDASLTA